MAMVSSSLGPINSLLHKLPVEPEFTDLKHALEGIKQLLLCFSSRGVVRSTLVQRWMVKLRELIYNVDDWMDSMLIHSWGRFKLKFLSSHRIRRFKDEILNMHDCGTTYGILGVHLAEHMSGEATVDPEDYKPCELLQKDGGFLCRQKPCLVGIHGPESQIVQHLMHDEQRVKVVCIFGPRGLGKTTLAWEVFCKYRSRFNCGAFVYVGQNPSIMALLTDIARQVMPKSLFPCDEEQIATKLWKFLCSKRYFIVIDDILSVSVWCSLRGVLPENNLGSRVLATTEIKHVANSCCVKSIDFVYLLKALSDSESRNLMLSRIYVSDYDCMVGWKIFESVIKVYGGTPLAINVASGLLAAQCATLTESAAVLEKAILSSLNQDFTSSQVIEKLLEISYVDLPLHVKSCFLYLSTFPENYTIKKDRLIWRWIAEGFIPKRNEESLWEIGESYFNELATRRLIQPVLDDDGDEAIGCTVHGMIRDFILSLSYEENFITLDAKLSGAVQRLTLDCNKQDEADALATSTMNLSRVRSFSVFGYAKKQMPDLSVFKLLRVLDLEDTEILDYHQLKSIGNMSLLRYLRLQGTGITKLPKQIMALQDLNTLDLRRTMVAQLPRFRTVKLASLLVDRLHLQRGIGKMQCLEELSTVIITPMISSENPSQIPVNGSDSLDHIAQLVSKSKHLRMLTVRFDDLFSSTIKTYRQAGVTHFLDEVAKCSIQSLILHDYPHNLVDLLVDFWAFTMPDNLRKFELTIDGHLSKVPKKMASLISLTHLQIKVWEVEASDLLILGTLPNLVLLYLISEFGFQERCTLTRDCFQCLKMFSYNCRHHGMGLQFQPGAMPQLQRLRISFEPFQTKSDYSNFNFGIQYLCHLVGVHATINCWRTTAKEAEAAEAAIREQVSQIPNTPILEFSREDEHFMING